MFHDIRFPTAIAFHSHGGPERKTEIVTLGSGYEERNGVWAASKRRYDVGYGVKTLDDIHTVLAFFEARAGRLYGFRFQDFADYKSGPPSAAITKPVAGSVRVAVNGIEQSAFTLDATTGLITFATAPPAGAAITAGFAFDVLVRFDTDTLSINLAGFAAGEIAAIPLVEIRL
jgi:hypothetical protein